MSPTEEQRWMDLRRVTRRSRRRSVPLVDAALQWTLIGVELVLLLGVVPWALGAWG